MSGLCLNFRLVLPQPTERHDPHSESPRRVIFLRQCERIICFVQHPYHRSPTMFCPNPDCDARRRNSAASCATWKNSGELLVSQLLQQVLQPLHRRAHSSGFGTRRSKVCAALFAASGTRPSRKNAKAIIRTLFKRCGKPWIGRRI
jgi:hypothetical protein